MSAIAVILKLLVAQSCTIIAPLRTRMENV